MCPVLASSCLQRHEQVSSASSALGPCSRNYPRYPHQCLKLQHLSALLAPFHAFWPEEYQTFVEELRFGLELVAWLQVSSLLLQIWNL